MDWLQAAHDDAALMDDFLALCAFGGRRSGTGQDEAAMAWALTRLQGLGGTIGSTSVPYDGWTATHASLTLGEGAAETALACYPLLRSASTPEGGLRGTVVDLGRGAPEDFARAGDALRGRIALVRHEYPFSPGHIHRRRKYDMAVAAGASAFLIANPRPGAGVLSGSSGRARDGAGIPAAYIDAESLARITAAGPQAHVHLRIDGVEQYDTQAQVGWLDIPGGRDSRVLITAHMDGHDLGVSALDNATGVAVALAAARLLAPRVGPDTPGLRVCFFCAEEWALAGSARYLADLPAAERDTLKLDINLDTVAGDARLTALISDFPALAPLVHEAGAAAGVPVDTYLPLMPNSDHANFAKHGIPAMRVVAGFDRPESRVNNILAAGDVPEIVKEEELQQALAFTGALGALALCLNDAQLQALAARAA
ncbi:M28 family peptidase [Achromobacter sp. GG226]|uniref:M28 family peptidase n=1 Tax=Verticiella alkaliphila TaxID=2779529 RepID=UPI001C0C3140|nr:M28 family peptidase [Verticiella sp. GG226]MBU4609744.1 M28 family peptidase [Verticiella sp. GG226]